MVDMSDRPAPRFRKTKSDKWAVMAPVEDLEKALAQGGKVDVLKRSGDWSSFTVASLGKPFDVDGVQMCYGYGPDSDEESESESRPEASNSVSRPSASRGRGSAKRSSRTSRSADGAGPAPSPSPSNTNMAPPPKDPSEPLPEFQGSPDDEWDGFF